jgi:hypothetical protein
MTGQRVSLKRVVISSIKSSVLLRLCVETFSGSAYRWLNYDLRVSVSRANHRVLKEELGLAIACVMRAGLSLETWIAWVLEVGALILSQSSILPLLPLRIVSRLDLTLGREVFEHCLRKISQEGMVLVLIMKLLEDFADNWVSEITDKLIGLLAGAW